MRVIGYKRVSTDRQSERGFGLPVQDRQIRDWCRAGGHRLVAVFADEDSGGKAVEGVRIGVGGEELEQRVGLGDALAALRARRAAGIVVPRLDRLARDLIVQEQLLLEVRRLGAVPFSVSAAEAGFLVDDPEDPSRKLIRQVLGAVSEYERHMVVLRMRRGRARKAEQGGFAYGSPPLGWSSVDGVLVRDDQAPTVDRIRELRAGGSSLRAVAAALTAEGHRSKRGGQWHPEMVSRVLARGGAR